MKTMIWPLLALASGVALAVLLSAPWPAAGAALGAGGGALLLRGGQRDGVVTTLASAALAALAALGLRWAIVVILTPAYPTEAARWAGPAVSAAIAGLCVVWAIADRRQAPLR
jgi:hypothetical protein